MLRPLLLVLTLALSLLAAACTNDPTGAAGSDAALAGSSEALIEFCDDANAFITDDSVTDVRSFSAAFFAGVDDRLTLLVDAAPDDLRPDLEVLRTGFAETDDIFANFDYDVTDARLGTALLEVDNEAMLLATDNIQIYLRDTCAIEPAGDVDTDQVEAIMAAFAVERPLAECLNAELGDVANVSTEDLTPELMTREVCGTSLLALLSGAPPPSG